MSNKQNKDVWWWGWLLFVPFSIALGLYGTTQQGGRYNINQLVFIVIIPTMLIVKSVSQRKKEKNYSE